jgi:hypothetical protein
MQKPLFGGFAPDRRSSWAEKYAAKVELAHAFWETAANPQGQAGLF